MIINLVGYWAIGLPAGFVLAFPVGMGATGLWWGLVIGLAIVALLLVYRIRVRFARDLPRVEVEDDGEEGMGNGLPGFGYQVPGVGGFGAVEQFLSTARGCPPKRGISGSTRDRTSRSLASGSGSHSSWAGPVPTASSTAGRVHAAPDMEGASCQCHGVLPCCCSARRGEETPEGRFDDESA
jgi:hypothetical protein